MYALRHNLYMKNVRLITLCITNTCVYLFAKPNFFFAGGESYFTPIFLQIYFSPLIGTLFEKSRNFHANETISVTRSGEW